MNVFHRQLKFKLWCIHPYVHILVIHRSIFFWSFSSSEGGPWIWPPKKSNQSLSQQTVPWFSKKVTARRWNADSAVKPPIQQQNTPGIFFFTRCIHQFRIAFFCCQRLLHFFWVPHHSKHITSQTNVAMENRSFVDVFPSGKGGFPYFHCPNPSLFVAFFWPPKTPRLCPT